MNRAEQIEELVNTHGYDAEQLKDLSDEELAAEHRIAVESDFSVETTADDELVFDDVTDSTVATNDQIVPPLNTDPAWNDYVMTMFVEEELQEGKPTVDGLRRVAELILGEIAASTTHVVQSPNPENGWTAVAVHTIELYDEDIRRRGKVYTGSADSNLENTEPPYNKYTTAIAETRAEARALRRLLRLRTVSAEEVSNAMYTGTPAVVKEEPINDQQLNVIDILANNTRGKNVDAVALAISLLPSYSSIRKLTHDDGITLITELNKYQRNEKGYESVPANLLGYKDDWRNR